MDAGRWNNVTRVRGSYSERSRQVEGGRTFEEVWNGEAFRRFRQQHSTGSEIPSGCDSCVHNGRKRHSPLFESVEPVSYRPLLKAAPVPPPERDIRLLGPREGEVVTDPLIIHGQLPSSLWQERGPELRWPRLYIDRTPVAQLDAAAIAEGRFLLVLPVPYLTEGAHVLSLGFADEETSPPSPGWDRRTFHFWRPRTEVQHLVSLGRAATVLRLPHPIADAVVRIDGQPWHRFSWYGGIVEERPWYAFFRPAKPDPCVGGVLLDLQDLTVGTHRLEIEPRGASVASYRLEHFTAQATVSHTG